MTPSIVASDAPSNGLPNGLPNRVPDAANGINGAADDHRPVNRVSNGASSLRGTHLRSQVDERTPHDLIGIGFGPANLALAIALEESLSDGATVSPKVRFLERQESFGWHEGMLLPSTKMQISFLKDLATMRNPCSPFTFLNYLHQKKRLVGFSNLGTFLPRRTEYADYMRWCAEPFGAVVDYGQDVVSVHPVTHGGKVTSLVVEVQDWRTREMRKLYAKKAVIAVGGRPSIPAPLPSSDPRVIHSSCYLKRIHRALPNKATPYTVAIIGGGQSAAEVFNDLQSRYPNARTRLVLKGSALRPSDDSPFVNEIFDPERVDSFYQTPAEVRETAIAEDKATNYGVVRLELLEHIYETMYMQKFEQPDCKRWQHQILNNSILHGCSTEGAEVVLDIGSSDRVMSKKGNRTQQLAVDAVIVAAGYTRNAHDKMLKPLEHLRSSSGGTENAWSVNRDYSLMMDEKRVDGDCGVYLSGCNETTHGLSDSLLSVLSTRAGELTQTMFDVQL